MSNAAINTELMILLNKAVNGTISELLDKLLDIIQETVYSYPATWTNGYKGAEGRTGDFGTEAWDATKASIIGNVSSAEIFENNLQYTAPFSHGLSAEGLADVINDGLYDTGIGFPAMSSRPFWTEFTTYIDNNFDRIFRKHCLEVGLPISATNVSINL